MTTDKSNSVAPKFEAALREASRLKGIAPAMENVKTISDVHFQVQHELDLIEEGSPNEIITKAQIEKVRAFLLKLAQMEQTDE